MNGQLITITCDPEGILLRDLSTIITAHGEVHRDHIGLMRGICEEHRALGLAANQAGLAMNMFWAAANSHILPGDAGHMCINPGWLPSLKTELVEVRGEGCLSIPGRRFTTRRYSDIEASWTNTQGHRVRRKLKNLAACVFQHETDHLRGVLLLESGEPDDRFETL